jgi:hypothetical protein
MRIRVGEKTAKGKKKKKLLFFLKEEKKGKN